MEKDDIVVALRDALKRLHSEHSSLLDTGDRGVREEALTFHVAGFLYNELGIDDREVALDVEYNKEGEDPKELEIPDEVREQASEQLQRFDIEGEEVEAGLLTSSQGAGFRPDIVIHQRSSHEQNIFLAEIKKNSADLKAKDAAKVLCLTHSETDYDYDYGAVIPLDRDFLQEQGFYWIENCELQGRQEVDIGGS